MRGVGAEPRARSSFFALPRASNGKPSFRKAARHSNPASGAGEGWCRREDSNLQSFWEPAPQAGAYTNSATSAFFAICMLCEELIRGKFSRQVYTKFRRPGMLNVHLIFPASSADWPRPTCLKQFRRAGKLARLPIPPLRHDECVFSRCYDDASVFSFRTFPYERR